VFCALPYAPMPHPSERVYIVGTWKMPFGGQTIYRSQMRNFSGMEPYREDIPIATWARNALEDKFQLSIIAKDSETRLKLKSIVPVLEHAPKPLPSKR
jgi:hypothetical protein